MGSILPFLPRGIFDDAATKVMGAAFDAARKALDDTGQPELVQEVMARRIIVAARKGERELTKLRDAALTALPTTSGLHRGSFCVWGDNPMTERDDAMAGL